MVNRARRAARDKNLKPPRISFVHAQLTEPLPIVDGSVDCILSNCVVNLLPPQGKRVLFGEIWRTLRPGGRIVLDDVSDMTQQPWDLFFSVTWVRKALISRKDHRKTST
jgi:arsenite methyltransferase